MKFYYLLTVNGESFEGAFGPDNTVSIGGFGIATLEQHASAGAHSLCVRFANKSADAVRLSRIDAGFRFEAADVTADYYKAVWLEEFEPVSQPITEPFCLDVKTGRSSNGFAPWLGLRSPDANVCLGIGWSGNWHIAVRPDNGGCTVFAGINPWEFYTDIAAGASFEGAPIYVADPAEGAEQASLALRRFFRENLSILSKDCPMLLPYNTWWPYEDVLLNEELYLKDAAAAGELGLTHALIDAGWFGVPGVTEDLGWPQKRGDWEVINREAFPSGMVRVGEQARERGVHFALWCEIETIGEKAALNDQHPELVARRDGESLGYLCFGFPETRVWAMQTIERLICEYGVKWIKFDFNVDPAAGCNCPEHGHGAGDGLAAHYRGYYAFLDTLHEKYPDVVLENCASGGLRLDTGMLSHTCFVHLSDLDHVEQHFSCFWGALGFLHQSACYHFTWSQSFHGLNIKDDPIPPDVPKRIFDYYVRACMTGVMGFSWRLAELPDWQRERLRDHVALYRELWTRFILNGDIYRLTGQALRGGLGDRWNAYQLMSDGDSVVFAFRLSNSPKLHTRVLKLMGLVHDACYSIAFVDSGETLEATGRELMETGLSVTLPYDESSEIVRVTKCS